MIDSKFQHSLFGRAMMMRYSCMALLIGCSCLVAAWGSDSLAASFTVPLHFEVVETEDGEELVAAFDFGVRFSQIESVTFSFLMEEGYEGTAVSTGNSSLTRHLSVEVRGVAGSNPSECMGTRQVTPIWQVPANEIFSIDWPRIGPLVLYPIGPRPEEGSTHLDGTPIESLFGPGTVLPSQWSKAFTDGAGRIAVVDYFQSTSHPLPQGVTIGSYTTRWAPDIAFATLTISGTLVPEPSGVIGVGLLVGWGLALSRCRGRGKLNWGK